MDFNLFAPPPPDCSPSDSDSDPEPAEPVAADPGGAIPSLTRCGSPGDAAMDTAGPGKEELKKGKSSKLSGSQKRKAKAARESDVLEQVLSENEEALKKLTLQPKKDLRVVQTGPGALDFKAQADGEEEPAPPPCPPGPPVGSAGGGAASSSGNIAASPGSEDGRRACSGCGQRFRCNELLLDGTTIESQEWAGGLWARCQACSGVEDPAVFKKQAKHRWIKRAVELKGKAGRAHSMTFHLVEMRIAELFPGASCDQRRKLVLQRVKAAALAIVASFTANPHKHLAAQAVGMAYMESLDQAAADPTFCATASGWTITQQEAQFLTVVATGTTISFLCRYRDCGFYGANHQWLEHCAKHEFRCPWCCRKYFPWRVADNLVPAQKMVYVSDLGSGAPLCFPATWAPNQDDGYFNNLLELEARNIDTAEAAQAFIRRDPADLQKLLKGYTTPLHFTTLRFRPEVAYSLLDERSYPAAKRAAIVEHGFDGAFYKWVEGVAVFREWEELAALIANLLHKSSSL